MGVAKSLEDEVHSEQLTYSNRGNILVVYVVSRKKEDTFVNKSDILYQREN